LETTPRQKNALEVTSLHLYKVWSALPAAEFVGEAEGGGKAERREAKTYAFVVRESEIPGT
jgi:hypothetical protein